MTSKSNSTHKDLAKFPLIDQSARDGAEKSELSSENSSKKSKGQPQRKKQKTTEGDTNVQGQGVRRVRGKRGLLNRLTELPLDIFYEILGQLQPVDLLHIARTTKPLRNTVLSRSATASWKLAFSNLASGLPACANDMSEQSYASLLFENFCHKCLSGTGGTIEWVLRMRFCNKCLDREFTETGSKYDDLSNPKTELFKNLVPNLEIVSGGGLTVKNLFYCKSMKEYFEVLCEDSKKPADWIEITEAHKQRRAHGKECSTWLAHRRRGCLDEGAQIRAHRTKAVIAKLTELGWGDEINKSRYLLTRHPLVSQKRALTDRIRNDTQPTLTKFLEDTQKQRIERQEEGMLKQRRPLLKKLRMAYARAVPPNSIIPPAADLNDYKPFRDIIEKTPSDQEVKLEDFNDAMEGLAEFVARWRESKDRELLRIMEISFTEDKPDYSPLNLATVFTCTEDMFRAPISIRCATVYYPQVLIHSGITVYSPNLDENLRDRCGVDRGKWNFYGQIKFNMDGHDAAKEIVSLSDLDPLVATHQDMDELDHVFSCITCTKDSVHHCMRWKDAISHILANTRSSSHGASKHSFTLITDQKAQKDVKVLLEQRKLYLYYSEKAQANRDLSNRFICTHCREKGSLLELKKHVENQYFLFLSVKYSTNNWI
ncbi:hypothetical protein BDQ17DRAFT_1363625, partial [Cyathus striatus]